MSLSTSKRGSPGYSSDTLLSIPTGPGSYALCLRLPALIHLTIGRSGSFDFPAGNYLYLGSARGPGGVRARLLHHFRPVVRPHWHLDWLRPHMELVGGWYTTSPGQLECEWSQAVWNLPGTAVPAARFGAADCRHGCPAHLLKLSLEMKHEDVDQCLGEAARHLSQTLINFFPHPL